MGTSQKLCDLGASSGFVAFTRFFSFKNCFYLFFPVFWFMSFLGYIPFEGLFPANDPPQTGIPFFAHFKTKTPPICGFPLSAHFFLHFPGLALLCL